MPRALSSHLSTSVAAISTQPRYLVELGTLRLTDGNTTTWNGHTWTSYPGMIVSFGEAGLSGQQSGSLVFPNHDLAISALVFSGDAADLPVSIWGVYGDGPHGVNDAALLATSFLDGASLVGNQAELQFGGASADGQTFPKLRVLPPTFKYLLPAGTEIWVGGIVIRIES